MRRKGAYHTSSVPYWFQTRDTLHLFRPTRLWGQSDRNLSARMMASLRVCAQRPRGPRRGRPGNLATNSWSTSASRSLVRENAAQLDFQHVPAQFVPQGAATPYLTRD